MQLHIQLSQNSSKSSCRVSCLSPLLAQRPFPRVAFLALSHPDSTTTIPTQRARPWLTNKSVLNFRTVSFVTVLNFPTVGGGISSSGPFIRTVLVRLLGPSVGNFRTVF